MMIVEIEVLPSPPGTADDPYRYVEAAIAVIEHAGMHYEVGALGTTYEGEPDAAWQLARHVHEACLVAGATSVVTIAKFAERADGVLSMDRLVSPFRSERTPS
jgi:uncharacterized protein YqgV (UPF0045/DUF77 family)